MLHYLLLLIPGVTFATTFFSDHFTPFQKKCLLFAWGVSSVIALSMYQQTPSYGGPGY